jgi:hypothetical protein
MPKKSVSGILASRRGSTYRSVRLASSLAAALPAERRVLARRGWAGENRGHFEHPETIVTLTPYGKFQRRFVHNRVISSLLEN